MTLKPCLRSHRLAIQTIALLLVCGSSLLASQDPPPDEIVGDTQIATTWFTMPFRVGIFVALVIVAWAFGFYVIFPWLLDRKHAMRPLQAYGLSAGLIWLAWCVSALVIFLDKLVVDGLDNGGSLGTFMKEWLLTCLICLAALVGFALLRMFFGGRSSTADA
jgi:hypothetical protein